MNEAYSGGCLCGAVRYESTAAPEVCGHCQCEQCRKTSGTGHASHMGVPKDAVTLTGETNSYDAKADSGNIVSRAFCPTCGSRVFNLNAAMPQMIFLNASTLDDPSHFAPQMVVWTSKGASWDLIDESLPRFDKNPPFMDE